MSPRRAVAVRARAWLAPRAESLARWADRRWPRLARAARPAWWVLNRRLHLAGYWAHRRHLRYYDEVVDLARAHVPTGESALDVGAGDSQVLRRLDWFRRRVALDRRPIPPTRGIERVVASFLDYRPAAPFDLVLCLQLLEHLDRPGPFMQKLLRTGRTVIISVPHRWPRGLSAHHVQDPVDEATLVGWAGRAPVETRVVHDGRERLVAVFRGSGAT